VSLITATPDLFARHLQEATGADHLEIDHTYEWTHEPDEVRHYDASGFFSTHTVRQEFTAPLARWRFGDKWFAGRPRLVLRKRGKSYEIDSIAMAKELRGMILRSKP